MKKSLLVIVIAFASMAALAQTNKMFTWGVEAGMNFNSLSFDKEMFESGNRAGFFVGPKVKVKVPIVGLGLEYRLRTICRHFYEPILRICRDNHL